MRAILTALLLVLALPATAQNAAGGGPFRAELAARVLSAALSFVAPRALDAVTVQQLALWGLGGPGTLDDALSAELRDGGLVLLRGDQVLFRQPVAPGQENDAAAWAVAVAAILEAAAEASPVVRAAGMDGLLGAFFDELFNHLDPYSRYVAPERAEADRSRRDGEGSAGLELRRTGNAVLVSEVTPDGPAAEFGIRPGDRLLAVDGQAVTGRSLETVQGWLAGPDDSELSLTIRPRSGAPRTVELRRATMVPETVFASRAGPTVLVRIAAFSIDTDGRLAEELNRTVGGAAGRGVRGLVLDLRGNRGGALQQAVSATDLLLTHGLIATTAGRSPEAAHEWRATGGDVAGGRPVVVLVDGRSASAAEIMAAALADRGRAVVVGSATLGKGLVQRILRLPDGGELFVSWSRVLAPAGWPLQGLGVLPQVCTSRGQDALSAQLASLRVGVQPMAAALARHRAARAPVAAAEALALRNACPAAEGREGDLAAARFLLNNPPAYAAALLDRP